MIAELRQTCSLQLSDGGIPSYSPEPLPADDLNATQRRILDYVTSHPGVHLRQICRELRLAMGDVQYHVHRLEKDGRISSVRRGLYRFFYPSSLFGERQKEVLGVLSLDAPRELLLHIIEKPFSRQDELARVMEVSQPTVSWHLKRLIELGIVQREQTGRGATYRVAGGGAAEVRPGLLSRRRQGRPRGEVHAQAWLREGQRSAPR